MLPIVHVTLLYPFEHPAKIASATVDKLERLFADVRAFDFELTEVRRFPATAYLHPDPTAPFDRLTEMLVKEWPECPPYGGTFASVIPHLTVADRVERDVLDVVSADVSIHLPIRCHAAEAWLLCSDERGFWSPQMKFAFGTRCTS